MITQSLQHFETFLAVAQTQSFTAAAKQLGTTKAAVSQKIRALESSLKLPLFIRSTRKVSLTDEGELLLAQCKRLQTELESARSLVSGFHDTPTGTLRVSCNPYFTESHLMPILRKYREQFPNVTIDILIEERMPDMQQENIDIVFGINWQAPDDVIARKIAKTRYVLCASPDYLKKFGTPKTLQDLSAHQYIPHGGRSPENLVVNFNKAKLPKINSTLTVNNAHIMKTCALNGWGIVQLHDYMVKEDIERGELIELLKDQLETNTPLYIYYQKHRFVQPKIRQFVNLILA